MPRRLAPACLLLLVLCSTRAVAQEEFKLDDRDVWKPQENVDPASPQGVLHQARVALAKNEPKRAMALMDGWLERNTTGPLRADALLIRGDSKLALDDEYEALFDYEEIARRYSFTQAFIPALEREYDIARAYAHGLKRKFFGTFRWTPSGDDAQEILIRIQERLPGSALAEKAGMELADYYFRNRDMPLAAEAYDLFVRNYPRSANVDKARLRVIYAYYSGYKGPQFDAKGLGEAASKLRELQRINPQLARQIGSEALLVRVYQSEAQKLLSQANWYWSVNDAISTELVVRRLVKRYPRSAAAIQALRQIDEVLKALPESVRKAAPDYATLRVQLGSLPTEIPPTGPDTAPAPSSAPTPPPPPSAPEPAPAPEPSTPPSVPGSREPITPPPTGVPPAPLPPDPPKAA